MVEAVLNCCPVDSDYGPSGRTRALSLVEEVCKVQAISQEQQLVHDLTLVNPGIR